MHAPSSQRPVLLKLPRASAAALIESVADAAAVASVTPDRAISGARAQSSERPVQLKLPRESKSNIVRERSRRSRGGERHTRQGDQRCPHRAASGLCRSSFRERARAALIESVADAAAAASVTPDRAISATAVHAPSSERPVPPKLPRESESSFDRERSRRSRGGERHTQQRDQRRAFLAASGSCCSSFREHEKH